MKWHSHAIGEVTQVNPKLATADRPGLNDRVSFVPMASVSEDTMRIAVHSERPFSEVAKGYTPFRRGDVLVAKITPCFENGKMALADDLPHELGFGTTEFHVFRPCERVTGRYLFNLLRVPWLRKAGSTKMRGAAGQRRVPADFFASVQIPIPPLAEQRRIAGMLDAADALRTKRREALAQLDTLLQSIFLDMFGDPATNPKGSEVELLGELIAMGPQNGLYKPERNYGSGVRILRIDGFYGGAVNDLSTLKRVSVSEQEIQKYGLSECDIVINRVNSRSHLGKSALIPDLGGEPVVFESNMMRLAVDSTRVSPFFMIHFLQTSFIRNQILRSAKDSINQASINQGDVRGLRILIPSGDSQRHFVSIAESIEQQKANQRAHLAELDTLFASLQSRAFRGDL